MQSCNSPNPPALPAKLERAGFHRGSAGWLRPISGQLWHATAAWGCACAPHGLPATQRSSPKLLPHLHHFVGLVAIGCPHAAVHCSWRVGPGALGLPQNTILAAFMRQTCKRAHDASSNRRVSSRRHRHPEDGCAGVALGTGSAGRRTCRRVHPRSAQLLLCAASIVAAGRHCAVAGKPWEEVRQQKGECCVFSDRTTSPAVWPPASASPATLPPACKLVCIANKVAKHHLLHLRRRPTSATARAGCRSAP